MEVAPLAGTSGMGYRTSDIGAGLAADLGKDESYAQLVERMRLLRRYLDKPGATLKKYLYELPEIADAAWNEELS
ncbi:hypothetical protein WBK31_32195 [Nonomuraea sp. N2-4H]|uniref:hypothetical protein n=1 Tax=Nonomuraea sp. N2-4H TaxID=3128898 RepID=UPI00324F61A0